MRGKARHRRERGRGQGWPLPLADAGPCRHSETMQNQYAGDIGDYVKLALLRRLSEGRSLGVAWYLYPNEPHKNDGRHTKYFEQPEKWRHLDPGLFDALPGVVQGERSVSAIERAGVLQATYAAEPVFSPGLPHSARSGARSDWFARTLQTLKDCDLIFADPDNGIVDDDQRRRGRKDFGKQIPLGEIAELATGRPVVVYHHNTRLKGGHNQEVASICRRLGTGTVAVRSRAYSPRTFFLVNGDADLVWRASDFCRRWADHLVEFVRPRSG